MKKCNENQILNPITKRCIDINGILAKKIIKNNFNDLLLDDQLKIKPQKSIPKQETKLIPKSKTIQEHKSKAKLKNIFKFINKLKNNKKNISLDKFCKTNNDIYLDKPIVFYTIITEVFIDKILNYSLFNKPVFNKTLKIINNIKFNNYHYNDFSNILNFENNINIKWINANNNYIRILNSYDIDTIYTYINNIKFVYFQTKKFIEKQENLDHLKTENDKYNYLLNKKLNQSIKDSIQKLYFNDINNIILKAPKLTDTMIVFTYLSKKYFDNNNNKVFISNDIIKATLEFNSVFYKSDDKYFIRIVLLKNDSCLLVDGLENKSNMTVLLPANTKYYILGKMTINNSVNICDKLKKEMLNLIAI